MMNIMPTQGASFRKSIPKEDHVPNLVHINLLDIQDWLKNDNVDFMFEGRRVDKVSDPMNMIEFFFDAVFLKYASLIFINVFVFSLSICQKIID